MSDALPHLDARITKIEGTLRVLDKYEAENRAKVVVIKEEFLEFRKLIAAEFARNHQALEGLINVTRALARVEQQVTKIAAHLLEAPHGSQAINGRRSRSKKTSS